jgi:hypothetical protein
MSNRRDPCSSYKPDPGRKVVVGKNRPWMVETPENGKTIPPVRGLKHFFPLEKGERRGVPKNLEPGNRERVISCESKMASRAIHAKAQPG